MEKTMTTYYRILFMISFGLLSCSGCAASTIYSPKNKLVNIQVLSHGYDKGGEFCKDFTLTSKQVELFFSLAKVLDPQLLHDQFDTLPCWVNGTAQSTQGKSQWEIHAGGTARIVFENGSVVLQGCSKCDAVLGDKKVLPKQ